MSKTGLLGQRFLRELSSNPGKEVVSSLIDLIEALENKPDPDPVEVRLLENIYHFIEKLKIMESNIRSYVRNSSVPLPGSKLSDLYEERLKVSTTSELFNY